MRLFEIYETDPEEEQPNDFFSKKEQEPDADDEQNNFFSKAEKEKQAQDSVQSEPSAPKVSGSTPAKNSKAKAKSNKRKIPKKTVTDVESSWLTQLEFDPNSSEIKARTNQGYEFPVAASSEEYQAWINSPSKGKHFHSNIRK